MLTEEAELIDVADMPALADGTAKRRTINAVLLTKILFEYVPIRRAYVEYVGARPGMALWARLPSGDAEALSKACSGR